MARHGLKLFRIWTRIRQDIRDHRLKSSDSAVSMWRRKQIQWFTWDRGSGFSGLSETAEAGSAVFNKTSVALSKLQVHIFPRKVIFSIALLKWPPARPTGRAGPLVQWCQWWQCTVHRGRGRGNGRLARGRFYRSSFWRGRFWAPRGQLPKYPNWFHVILLI
jgi:hypothetical protein